MPIWNPWHGCRKISPGCAHCYVYRRDESIGKDASIVAKTGDFNLPLRKNRQGAYKLTPEEGVVFTCMTSDFFLPEADEWRSACWDMIRQRNDLRFYIITKRIDRFSQCAPPDWGDGWEHVTISCTCGSHAADFVEKRLSSENPVNDGQQTPMKGHPVFTAQHATACCCRACLEKWHRIPAGKPLSAEEQHYIVDVLMTWIEKEM